MGSGDKMADFWDKRAAENAYFFVDNRVDYDSPDTDRFWSRGEEDLTTLLDVAGAQIAADDDVVEIGCGLGRLTRGLAARGSTVRALDVSGEMLQRAQQLNPALDNVTWIHGDGASLTGVDTRSADACVSHVVFQHVPDPAITMSYITEMGRILRPGGWSAFQVSNDPSVHSPSLLRRLKMWRADHKSRAAGGQRNPNWLGSAVSLPELERTAKEAGLEVAHMTGEGTQYCVIRLDRPA